MAVYDTDDDDWGDMPHIPADSEAMDQLKAIMKGRETRCSLCHAVLQQAFLVPLHDDAALCCLMCMTILNSGALE